jgi:hypothetical protein
MAADDAFDLPDAGEEEAEVMGGLDEDEAMKDLDGMDEEDDFPVSIKVGEEKEIGKQGLRKKLVKEGEGWERPETGDEVEGTQRMPALPLCASFASCGLIVECASCWRPGRNDRSESRVELEGVTNK